MYLIHNRWRTVGFPAPTALAAHHAIDDPETGGRFTVKKYSSRKTAEEDAWRHVEIRLEPLNPEFEAVIIAADDEDSVRIVAEFIDTL
jgi:hypothetical protein